MKSYLLILTLLITFFFEPTVQAKTYQLPLPGDSVIGKVQIAYAMPGQTIDEVAQQYDVGYYEILAANPHVNPQNLMPFQKLTIPSQFFLPDKIHSGIVINNAELRLYYYPPGKNTVETYPVAIGMPGQETPTGDFTVISKTKHPTWRVPQSVRDEMAKQGIFLPKVMPAGPDNPLGNYKIRLNNYSYLIHGTNVPETVGRRASAGCLHMFPEDITSLFPKVTRGTTVSIIDKPFSAGWSGNQLYFKAVQPLIEDRANLSHNYGIYWNQAVEEALTAQTTTPDIDWSEVKQAGINQTGIPVIIAQNTLTA